MKKRFIISVMAVFVCFCAFLIFKIRDKVTHQKVVKENVQQLPNLPLSDLDSSQAMLYQVLDNQKTTLLIFFNPSCEHCQEAHIALERLYEFAKITPEYKQVKDLKIEKIEFSQLKIQGLTFRFAGSKPLLKNIDLQLNKGEIVALVGESSSGKSIFLQILQRFYPMEKGTILVNEHDWEQIDLQAWRNLIGVVPQEVRLFNGTLLYNIALKELKEDEAKNLILFLQQTGFHQFFKDFPQNYLTLLGETGINLSGGQKQLIGLARALYRQPQLLLLDEPTSAMDKQTEKFVIYLLQSLKNQIAILLITHKSSQAEMADRVYALEKGSLLFG